MNRRLFLGTITVFPSWAIASDTGDKFNGIWELTVSKQDGSTWSTIKKLFVFQKEGQVLHMKDLQADSGIQAVGIKQNDIQFRLVIPGEASQPANLSGTYNRGKFSGMAEIDGVSSPWEAAKLGSAWLCSNHKPVHVASSEVDMKKLTEKNKCQGWSKMRTMAQLIK